MEEYSVIQLLEELKNDASWCENESLRKSSVDKFVYFLIEM